RCARALARRSSIYDGESSCYLLRSSSVALAFPHARGPTVDGECACNNATDDALATTQSTLRRRPALVILGRYRREPFDEGGNLPDFVIARAGGAEARHAGHLDAVLDHPEQLIRRALGCDLLQ